MVAVIHIRTLSLTVSLALIAACGTSTEPIKRFDGKYALTSPVPYQHTLNGETFNVLSETLYVYAGDELFERRFVTAAAAGGTEVRAACCGSIWESGDSIYFGGQGASDSQRLHSGTLSGGTLTVQAANSVALLPWSFVFTRVR